MNLINRLVLIFLSPTIIFAEETVPSKATDLPKLFSLTFLGTIITIASVYLILRFFKLAKSLIEIDKDGIPNGILGYNIAFDFMAWFITGIIIVISFILLVFDINKDLIILILGISIGSVLTRTPSFKEKSR